MSDPQFNAKLAAVWLVHGQALAKLLHSHGRTEHAVHVEEALEAFMDIVSQELGGEVLRDALDGVTQSLWQADTESGLTH